MELKEIFTKIALAKSKKEISQLLDQAIQTIATMNELSLEKHIELTEQILRIKRENGLLDKKYSMQDLREVINEIKYEKPVKDSTTNLNKSGGYLLLMDNNIAIIAFAAWDMLYSNKRTLIDINGRDLTEEFYDYKPYEEGDFFYSNGVRTYAISLSKLINKKTPDFDEQYVENLILNVNKYLKENPDFKNQMFAEFEKQIETRPKPPKSLGEILADAFCDKYIEPILRKREKNTKEQTN